MPGIEFVPGPDDESWEPAGPSHRAPVARGTVRRRGLLVAGAVVALAAAVTVVVTQRPDSTKPHAAATHPSRSPSSTHTPAPSPTVSTLALPEQLAFGPNTRSVLVSGNRIFGLTSRLIGAVQRDGGALVVRPTTNGSDVVGTPRLVSDEKYSIIWAIAIGGKSIGAFEPLGLATRDDLTGPGALRGAAAYLGELWFVTAKGLYRLGAGQQAPTLVSAQRGLVAVAADPTRRRLLVLGDKGVEVFMPNGDPGLRAPLPFLHGDDIAVADGQIWITGHYDVDGLVFHIEPDSLHPMGPPAAAGTDGGPHVVATFRDRIVVAGVGAAASMSCLNAHTGAELQAWPYRPGAAVALNERGMLVSEGYGIELRNARDCLAGA